MATFEEMFAEELKAIRRRRQAAGLDSGTGTPVQSAPPATAPTAQNTTQPTDSATQPAADKAPAKSGSGCDCPFCKV